MLNDFSYPGYAEGLLLRMHYIIGMRGSVGGLLVDHTLMNSLLHIKAVWLI